jgi:hypothetical protein
MTLVMPLLLPAVVVVLVGALTARTWMAMLPLLFWWSFGWGGLSVHDATVWMLVVALVLGAADAASDVVRRRRLMRT